MPYDPTPSGDLYYNSIQWDPTGRPYQMSASGQKVYISPAAAATEHTDNPVGAKLVQWANSQGATYANPGGASPQSGFASNRGTFDTGSGNYDGGNFFNTSLGGLLLGGGMIGAPYLAGALASGGGAGAGTNAAVGNAAAAGTGPATTSAAAGLAIPTTEGIGSATSLGLPVTEGLGSAGAAGGAAAGLAGQGTPGSSGYAPGNSFPGGIPSASGLPDGWSTLLKALAGVGGLVGGNALANAGASNAVPPQLSQLLDLSMQRANSQTPLFNATQKGFYDMLPNFAKTGGS